jgi:phosphate/phosphite/phosphonate ABC transporter binding protein
MADMLVFGYVAEDGSDAARERMAAFAIIVANLSSLEIVTCRAHSYTELAAFVHKAKVDFAWLPPIPYIALARHDRVTPLVSLRRAGHSEFYSVLVVRADSKIANPRDLQGKRAAWVDPHSASGYALPRIGLSAVGVDPRVAFSAEKFLGSHEGVIRAVVSRRADFGATHGGLDEEGTIGRGAWLDMPGADRAIRVLATFGAIPADLIAARSDLEVATRERLTRAFMVAVKEPKNRLLLRDLFGVDEFRRGAAPGYQEFREAVMRASSEGLLEGEETS